MTSIALLACMLLCTAGIAAGQSESLLYSFQGNSGDGADPFARLVADANGNLYSTTHQGGTFNCGSVFKLTPSGAETVLYSFTCGADGAYPDLAGVVLDKAGNLYGTTIRGGAGYGVVYQLTPSGVETPLYTFSGTADGAYPQGGVVLDGAGNLYGTTVNGGPRGYGTVFKVTPNGVETVLHSFIGGSDGANPVASLVFGPKKTLYGTTTAGGANFSGTVYKMSLSGTVTILHNFANDGVDGVYPTGNLLLDKAGNIFGVTEYGGANNFGTVYQVTPTGNETILHNFINDGTDGVYPYNAGVVLDGAGNMFGTTSQGGTSNLGTVFEISSTGSETVLHSFQGSPDGTYPYAGLLRGKKKTLYGTASGGGAASGNGAVFKVTY